jgi:hypothetical protein
VIWAAVSVPQWFLLGAFAVFLVAALHVSFRAVSSGGTRDFAARRGNTPSAVFYSITGAMLPWKKESARLHPASYTLGITFHLGVFLGFLWVVVLFVGFDLAHILRTASAGLLLVTSLCGVALLVKRIVDPKLRYFSSADDYFSNVLVTGFQVVTALGLLKQEMLSGLFVYAGILLLYIPVGKLRHAIYFGFARFHLGRFYGRRGVWPVGGRR